MKKTVKGGMGEDAPRLEALKSPSRASSSPPHESTGETPRSFEELRALGRAAFDRGEAATSLEWFDAAHEAAAEAGRIDQRELSICDRAVVLIHLDRCQEIMRPLREILLNASLEENSFLAAYNLARAYENLDDPRKSFFYGRVAHERAASLERPDWLLWSRNQMGNALVGQSRFEEAREQYREALRLPPYEQTPFRALVLGNLGYCAMMLDELEEGHRLVRRCLAAQRQLEAPVLEIWPHLDLCYLFLEWERPELALLHGHEALRLARETSQPSREKMALFLLGEAQAACGDDEAASQSFDRLENDFFPQYRGLSSVLRTMPMRQLINIRA